MSDNDIPKTQELDWYDTLILKGKLKAEASQSVWVRTIGVVGLDMLAQNKDNLYKLGQDYLKKLVGDIASENIDVARESYIKNCMQADELISGVETSGDRIIAADQAHREYYDKFQNILKSITGELARILFALIA